MKEKQIREMYPNRKNEENYEKSRKVLKYTINIMISGLCAWVLIFAGGFLFTINLTLAIICWVASVAAWVFAWVRWGRNIKKFDTPTTSIKKVENRYALTHEALQNALKKDNVKQNWTAFVFCEIIGLFCAIVWGLIVPNDDEVPNSIIVLIFFVMIPLVAFGIFNIYTIFERTKTKNTSYILLHTKVAGGLCTPSADSEGGSDNYYLIFDCGNYGSLSYEVSSYGYHSAAVGKDAYYLVVVKKRFSKKYRIVKIILDQNQELSPELERIVVFI